MRIYVYIWSFPEIGTISEQSFYRWRTSSIDHLFGGTPIYGNLHMCIYVYPYVYIYMAHVHIQRLYVPFEKYVVDAYSTFENTFTYMYVYLFLLYMFIYVW